MVQLHRGRVSIERVLHTSSAGCPCPRMSGMCQRRHFPGLKTPTVRECVKHLGQEAQVLFQGVWCQGRGYHIKLVMYFLAVTSPNC